MIYRLLITMSYEPHAQLLSWHHQPQDHSRMGFLAPQELELE